MKNNNKIVSAGLAGLFCAVTLAGCGGAASSAASSEAASSAAATEAPAATAAPTATAAPAATEAPMPGNVLYLAGTVSNASMNAFTLTMADGTTAEIMIADDCEKDLANGLSEGAEITVGGTTEDGGKTLTAVYLADGAEDADVLYGAAKTLVGTVSDAAMNGFTLTMNDGSSVEIFKQDDTDMELSNGLSEGLTVAVTGSLGDAGTFVAQAVTDDANAIAAYSHETTEYTGTLKDCMMSTFGLVTASGEELTFVKDDACTVDMALGLVDGANVIVTAYDIDGTLMAVNVLGAE